MPPLSTAQSEQWKIAQLNYALEKLNSDDEYVELVNSAFSICRELKDINLLAIKNRCGTNASIVSSPLHIAIHQKHLEILNDILKRDAVNITIKNEKKNTALMEAFLQAYDRDGFKPNTGLMDDPLVMRLLKAHVDFDESQNPQSPEDFSHFHIACAANHLKVVEYFLDKGVPVNGSVGAESSVFAGYTSLHFAAEFCSLAVAKVLLQHGADVTKTNSKGLNALHLAMIRKRELKTYITCLEGRFDNACLRRSLNDNEAMLYLFLKKDEFFKNDRIGLQKFNVACTLSDCSLVKRLLQGNVDLSSRINANSPIWPGYSALHFAASLNLFDTCELLVKAGADLAAKDAKGKSPFDTSMDTSFHCVIRRMLPVASSFRNIHFSDNKTKPLDLLTALDEVSTLKVFLQNIAKTTISLPSDCPLWPGFNLAHLLVYFSRPGDVELMTAYISMGGCDTNTDANGKTPLHMAFYLEKYEILDIMLNFIPGLKDIADPDGLSHLHLALMRGNATAASGMLQSCCDVNRKYTGIINTNALRRGCTPLHLAVLNRHEDVVRTMVLQHAADGNIADVNGLTPVHYILRFCCEELKDVNVSIGNFLFSRCVFENILSAKTGVSYFHVACSIGNELAVRSLISLKSNINQIIADSKTLEEAGLPVSLSGCLPVHLAMFGKYEDIGKLLMDFNCDFIGDGPAGLVFFYDLIKDMENQDNYQHADTSANATLVLLLRDGPKFERQLETFSGITLLHVSCFLYDSRVIENMVKESPWNVKERISINSPMWPGCTPLHILVRRKMTNLQSSVNLLLRNNASVMEANLNGDTPLHVFFKYHRHMNQIDTEILRSLVKSHTNFKINPVNQEGITHFHLACIVGDCLTVKQFLDRGTDVNFPIDYLFEKMTFRTPLNFTLEYLVDNEVRLPIVKLLIKYGADVNAQTESGITPLLQAACKGVRREMTFEELLRAGADINATTLQGDSAVALLLSSTDDSTSAEISFFLDNGFNVNRFNYKSGKGILSMILVKHEEVFKQILVNPNLLHIDQKGRTPIHNFVANTNQNISAFVYESYIRIFCAMGFKIDTRDSTGVSAFETASHFKNLGAMHGLLLAEKAKRNKLFLFKRIRGEK